MKTKMNEFWNAIIVISFGMALLIGFVFACEFVAWRIFGLPMMWLPFLLVGGVFLYAVIRRAMVSASAGTPPDDWSELDWFGSSPVLSLCVRFTCN